LIRFTAFKIFFKVGKHIITKYLWVINRIICTSTAVCRQLDTLGRGLRMSAASDRTEYTTNCMTLLLLYVGRHGETQKNCCYCEQMLPWRWTEDAASWISQSLGLLVFRIDCEFLAVAPFCYWQCLLTVGGNLLPHTVTPLDVTTVAWCCRQTQDFLQSAESPTAALQTSQWQWTASVFTLW